MIPVSLGYTCFTKSAIVKCGFNYPTNIFDWLVSFNFGLMITSLEKGFDIFNDVELSALLGEDVKSAIYNRTYKYRMPHDGEYWKNKDKIINKYKRRFDRFLQYKEDHNSYLYIRAVNDDGYYGQEKEDLLQEYNENNRRRMKNFLPSSSLIVLLSHKKINENIKSCIRDNYILLDNVYQPNCAIYIGTMENQKYVTDLYKAFFVYISKNFELLRQRNRVAETELNQIIEKKI